MFSHLQVQAAEKEQGQGEEDVAMHGGLGCIDWAAEVLWERLRLSEGAVTGRRDV